MRPFKILDKLKAASIPAAAAATLLCTAGGPSQAAPCDQTTTVNVPFTWSLSQTGQNMAEIHFSNDGTGPTVVSASKVFTGKFKVDSSFSAPAVICSQIDPTPTAVTLDITGRLVGSYANSSAGFNANGFPFETYVRVDGSVNLLPAFAQQSFGGLSNGSIQVLRATSRAVGVGDLLYAGNLDVATRFGFGIPGLQGIQGHVWLDLQAELVDPVVNIGFTVPAPIPEPPLWALLATGLAVLAGRQRRNRALQGSPADPCAMRQP